MSLITFDDLPEIVSTLINEVRELKKLIKAKSDPDPSQSERLLTVDEAAEFLKLTKPTIYSKVSRGELPVMKQGNRLYFSDLELLEYVRSGRRKTTPEIEAGAERFLSNQKRAE